MAIIRALFGHEFGRVGRETAIVLARVNFDSRCIGKIDVQVRVQRLFWPREELDLDDRVFATWKRPLLRLRIWQRIHGIQEGD